MDEAYAMQGRGHNDTPRQRSAAGASTSSTRSVENPQGAEPPPKLAEIYRSFLEDDAMLQMLCTTRPEIVSFHFGIPAPERVDALRAAGMVLLGSATNLAEGRALESAGVDAVIAQGYELSSLRQGVACSRTRHRPWRPDRS